MQVSALWAVVSQFLAASTCEKVRVFSWNDTAAMQAALCEACGGEHLPQQLGGKRENAPPYAFSH